MRKTHFMYLLALVMMLTWTSVVITADVMTTYEKAEVLFDLGLFSGISTDRFKPDLESKANREQAAKMVTVALGWSIEGQGDSEFKDVSDWAQPYVGLAVEKGVTKGAGLDKTGYPVFDSQMAITERQLSTWFDRVIWASDTAWENNSALDDTVGITRGQLVEQTYEALKQVPVGQDKRLIETVLAGDEVKLQLASEGGLMTDSAPVADGMRPDIAGIVVNDDDKIIITFTEAVEAISAVDLSHYTIYDNTYKEVPGIVDQCTLVDATRVMLTFTKKFSGPHRIAVVDVEDLSGEAALTQIPFDMSLNSGDNAISGINAVDDRTVKLTFSSKLNDSNAETFGYYTLYDEEGLDVTDQIKDLDCPNTRNVTITFNSYLSGRYVLSIYGMTDKYGHMIKDQITFNMDFNEGAPSITAIEVRDEDRINVTFSEALDIVSAEDSDSYRLYDEEGYFVENQITRVDMDGDKEVRIHFDKNLGGVYTFKARGVMDLDGEKSDNEFQFTVDKDSSTPVMEDIDVEDGDRIEVTFSKAMDSVSIQDKQYYALYLGETEVTDYIKKIGRRSEEAVVVYFNRYLEGTYALAVDGAEDINGNNIDDMESFDIIPDYSDPSLSSLELVDDDEIILTFSESVEQSSAEDEDHYRLYSEDGSVVEDIIKSATLDEDNARKVTIVFTEEIEGTFTIRVWGVEDFYENAMDNRISFTMTGDWYPPNIDYVEVDSMVTIFLGFTEAVNASSASRRSNYILYDNDGKNISSTIESVAIKDDDRVLITLREGLYKSYNIRVINVMDLSGNVMDDHMDFEIE